FGHTAPNCPHRTNFSYQGTPPSPALTALTATTSGSFSNPNIWLTGSGATNHMRSDLQLLSNITPSTSMDNVTIGNGTGLRIANVGSSSLVSGHQVFHLPE
ncbi:PREDICTED: Retrovirus-related Pol poly from transposon TNT, partial [Prunus dulcis]